MLLLSQLVKLLLLSEAVLDAAYTTDLCHTGKVCNTAEAESSGGGWGCGVGSGRVEWGEVG